MFGLVDRVVARGEVPCAPRPAATPSSRRRGPDAPDADALRSASPWFGGPDPTATDLSFRTGSGWSTGASRGRRPLAVVTKVGSPTGSDWRHPAVQLR